MYSGSRRLCVRMPHTYTSPHEKASIARVASPKQKTKTKRYLVQTSPFTGLPFSRRRNPSKPTAPPPPQPAPSSVTFQSLIKASVPVRDWLRPCPASLHCCLAISAEQVLPTSPHSGVFCTALSFSFSTQEKKRTLGPSGPNTKMPWQQLLEIYPRLPGSSYPAEFRRCSALLSSLDGRWLFFLSIPHCHPNLFVLVRPPFSKSAPRAF